MYYAWGTHPAFFIAMAVLCCALVVILAHVYLKNCGFRYKKRFEATQFGPRLFFFADDWLRLAILGKSDRLVTSVNSFPCFVRITG